MRMTRGRVFWAGETANAKVSNLENSVLPSRLWNGGVPETCEQVCLFSAPVGAGNA